MSDQRKYVCDKCKAPTWLSKPVTFCVCGGKLYPVDIATVAEVFSDMFKKGKK